MPDETVIVPPPAPKEPETFSREYVRELREENKGWRLKATTLEQERDAAKKASEDAGIERDAKVKTASEAANARILMAELKAEALKAGMIDLDGLKLADLSSVSLQEDGAVKGSAKLFEDLKKAKPYLFGASSSSSTGTPPKVTTSETKKATEMEKGEYETAKAALIKTSRRR